MIVYVFIAQIVVSFCAAVMGASWTVDNMTTFYLSIDMEDKWAVEWGYLLVGLTGTWILIFT